MRRDSFRCVVTAFISIALIMLASARVLAGTTGGIQGFVTDEVGHPIAGAAVSAASPSGHASTITGANGFYAVNGLPLDTYTITVSKDGFLTLSIAGVTIVQDQTRRVNVRLSTTSVKSLGRVTVRSSISLVQPTVTADTYVINQQRLSDLNGTPQDLNGFAAFNSLPGVTTDNFGYPVIRAGAENDVGYELDGVDNTDAVTGQFLNAVSLNGARSVQLSTGGYDVSEGNTNSGVINEVISRGSYPGGGEATARMTGPTYGHELSIDYGSATPNNRFSYYFSYGGQRDASDYGDRRTIYPLQLANTDFTTLNDEVLNLFYHFGEGNKNEVQFLSNLSGQTFSFGYLVGQYNAPYASNNGNVQAGSDPFGLGLPPPGSPSTLQSDYFTLYPGEVGYRQNTGAYDTQTFNSTIDKLNFKRQLSASSFGEIRVFRTSENLVFRYPYNVGSFSDFYEDLQTTNLGEAFDYTNQVSSKHELSFGSDVEYFKNRYSILSPSFENTYEPLEDLGCPQIGNAITNGLIPAANETSAYISNAFIGGCYIAPFNNALNLAFPGLGLPTDPAHAPLSTYVSNAGYSNDPLHRYDVYVKDQFQPSERMTITFGLRYDKESLPLPANAAQLNTTYFIDDSLPVGCSTVAGPPPPAAPPCTLVTVRGQPIGSDVTQPSQLSPRLAFSYELGARDVMRFSYGKNIEFVPTSDIETTYQPPASLQSCSLANGCFVKLPGFSPTCVNGADPAHGDAPCNDVRNLYQQVMLDLTTNFFAQYTPVRPQRAVNYDFSYSHDFGNGVELRVTPYYRKGIDYVVGNQKLLFVLPSGTAVFGPSKEENAGVNENTGVEFALQRNVQYGLSGLIDATYDNTLANYDSDFFPTVNSAALAANHFFHVTYVTPLVGTLNLVYTNVSGFTAETTVSYEYGYPYGVGKKTFIFGPNGQPEQVLNTDVNSATGVAGAYYLTDSTGTKIVASRGTPEGDDPGTLRGPPITLFNFTLSHTLGSGPKNSKVGLRVENLFGNYAPSRIPANPYYGFNGFGNNGLPSGVNPNACAPHVTFACEPFQYNYGAGPYEIENNGTPRVFTLFFNAKY